MSITISENRSDIFNQRLGNDKIGITTYPIPLSILVRCTTTDALFSNAKRLEYDGDICQLQPSLPQNGCKGQPRSGRDSIAMSTPTQVLQDAIEANHRRLAPPTVLVHGRAPFDEPVVTCRRLEVAEETGIILLGRAATVDHMAPHCFGPQHGGSQASFEASTHRQTSNAPGTTSDILQRVPFSV